MKNVRCKWAIGFAFTFLMVPGAYSLEAEQHEKVSFVGLTTAEYDLLSAASGKDPYVLLGRKELELFRACVTFCQDKSFPRLQECVGRFSGGTRIVRKSTLNNIAFDALEVLSMQDKNDRRIKDLMARIWRLMPDLKRVSFEKDELGNDPGREVYLCRGSENEWLAESRIGPREGIVPFCVQYRLLSPPTQNVVLTGEVSVTPSDEGAGGGVAATTIAPLGGKLTLFGTADVGDDVTVEKVQIGLDHFVGTFFLGALGSFTPGGIAKGIRINFSRPPESGVFIKTIVTARDTGAGTGGSLIDVTDYVIADGTLATIDLIQVGNATDINRICNIGQFTSPAPTFVEVLFAGDAAGLENASLSFKIIGLNVNTVVSTSMIFP